MKITFLGQAGLLFEKEGLTVMLDPYFSDSAAKEDERKHRRIPVDTSLLKIKPDVLIFTHDHTDHYDEKTAKRILPGSGGVTVLSPRSVWQKARGFGGDNNYVVFDRGTEWTQGDVRFTAVKAVHSEPYAIGVIIEDLEDGRKYYITGDTLYSESIFCDIPRDIFALFLPINGEGNNMNELDAMRFAARVGARFTVPFHVGLLDDKTDVCFVCENKVSPKIYEEIKL